MEQQRSKHWGGTAYPIPSLSSLRSRFVDLPAESLISGRCELRRDPINSAHVCHLVAFLQVCSQRAGSRPSGVGLLIAGRDTQGCHLYQVCPSGNLYDHVATAIGMALWQTRRSPLYPKLFWQLQFFHLTFRGEITSFKNIFGKFSFSDGQPASKRYNFTRAARAEGGNFGASHERHLHIAVVGVEMPFRVLDEDELRSPLAELAADTRWTCILLWHDCHWLWTAKKRFLHWLDYVGGMDI